MEDDEYTVTPEEERQQIVEAVGEEFVPDAYADPRSTYNLAEKTSYPEYSYETKGGKVVKVRHDEMGTFWHVEFVPGGQLPMNLSGKYTTSQDACKAVEIYLAQQD